MQRTKYVGAKYLIIQNFFSEYSSKKYAAHCHRTGTPLGRLPPLASAVLTWTHSPLHFPEISGSAFFFPPLLFHLVRPCRREVWDGLRGASSGFPLPRTFSLVLVGSQSPEPAAPSGAFTRTHPLVAVPNPAPHCALILPGGNGPLLLGLHSEVTSFRNTPWISVPLFL